ncbi:hypothetical protein HY469_02090 [Candidatus Roizmanbacteria bacterium]|nr:hypothetical protein [Candidatus Roizmanbacteria bacterium]
MIQQHPLLGFGVIGYEDKILLLCKKNSQKSKTFHSTVSTDGIHFYFYDDTGIIIREDRGFEDVATCSNFSISRAGESYVMVYTRGEESKTSVCHALSNDAIHWYCEGPQAALPEEGVVVDNYRHDGSAVMYGGTSRIYAATSQDLYTWERHTETVYRSKNERIRMGCAGVFGDYIHLFYVTYPKHKKSPMRIRVLRFDAKNPFARIDPVAPVIWEQHGELADSSLTPVGLVRKEHMLFSYWHDQNGNMIAISHVLDRLSTEMFDQRATFAIQKHHQNPILSPISSHIWESQAVFNAAAVYEDGKVHLIYRAVGNAGVSMLGYAASSDGITIDERHRHPVYVPRQPFEGSPAENASPYPNPYVSGPSWGGVEDPRLARVGDRFYLTYVAFDGWSAPRLALSSIASSDFLSQNWNWETPVLISRPGEVNKSGAILPEPVNGKYYIFHRVYPDLLIDTVEDLRELDGTRFVEGKYAIRPRPGYWDSRKLGVGATPLKTDKGWLVIYHGVDDGDDSRYKIGAMLLDLDDPTKVIARTPYPIIEPTEHYENGLLKYGVVYPCGAVILDEQLIVYYGGSDAVLCAATAPLNDFLNKMLREDSPVLEDYRVSPVVHYT